MTEAEWLSNIEPAAMLEYVVEKASDRKLRLFGVACCRPLCVEMPDALSWLSVAENWADGIETKSKFKQASKEAAQEAFRANLSPWGGMDALKRSISATVEIALSPPRRIRQGFEAILGRLRRGIELVNQQAAHDAQLCQISLLRDLFGNPFHLVSISPTILSWHDSIVVSIAQTTYQERQLPAGTLYNDHLEILADALEEAGCTNADILNHCRQPGEHVRGCWVIDLILGKE